ncbi:unnamed protein product [Mytilus coruscus]|uniref:Uncharacterized protein n=1 Tax=Mytilus coruscus TaxID=42192 RepID=A0A6J8AQJ8_MYTCO|nr:unnamed protein product [Mytilus coruscus]
MEPRITRQSARGKLKGNIHLVKHNKELRMSAQSLPNKSEKMVSKASLKSSVVSASLQRKRSSDQIIKEPKAKVAKASVPSTSTTVKRNTHNSKALSIRIKDRKISNQKRKDVCVSTSRCEYKRTYWNRKPTPSVLTLFSKGTTEQSSIIRLF